MPNILCDLFYCKNNNKEGICQTNIKLESFSVDNGLVGFFCNKFEQDIKKTEIDYKEIVYLP